MELSLRDTSCEEQCMIITIKLNVYVLHFLHDLKLKTLQGGMIFFFFPKTLAHSDNFNFTKSCQQKCIQNGCRTPHVKNNKRSLFCFILQLWRKVFVKINTYQSPALFLYEMRCVHYQSMIWSSKLCHGLLGMNYKRWLGYTIQGS